MKQIWLWGLLGAVGIQAADLSVVYDRPEAVYTAGEAVEFRASAREGDALLRQGEVELVVTRDGGEELLRRRFDLSREEPLVRYVMSEPGFVWCNAKLYPQGNEHYAAVAFSPLEIKPGQETEPADFDAFWQQGIAEANAVDLDVRITPAPDLSDETCDVSRISFANLDGTRLYGTLSVPNNSPGPWPAVLFLPGAGPASDSGKRLPGVITLFLNVHTYEPLPDSTTAEAQEARVRTEYADQLGEYFHYPYIGARDRNRNFYRRAWLGANHAVEWLRSHPGFDGRNLGVVGGSQGGASTLALAALNANFTYAVCHVPGMCDHNAELKQRAAGWPGYQGQFRGDERVLSAIPYFDGVNFAKRIRCPIVMTVGFIDYVCHPATVYAAYNNLAAQDKRMVHMVGEGHAANAAFDREVERMLATFQAARGATAESGL